MPGKRDKLEALQADIVTLEVDGIVNAANTSPLGRSGIDRHHRLKRIVFTGFDREMLDVYLAELAR